MSAGSGGGSGADPSAPPTPARTAAVIVASTGAALGRSADRTGPVIRAWLQDRGFDAAEPVVVADGGEVGEALRRALAAGCAVVLTTGGTGVSPDDATPEQTEPLLDVRLPGIMEALRRAGEAATPRSLITRGLAGFAGRAFVMNLPGSPGGVADGLRVLDPLLEHLLAQRSGQRDHPRER